MGKRRSILVLIVISVALEFTTPEKQILLQDLFRDGASYPSENWDSTTNTFADELTSIGNRQHYILGSVLQQTTYKDFFSYYFKPNELWVRSIRSHKAVQSSMAHVMGIFDKFETEKFPFDKFDKRTWPPLHKNTPYYNIEEITWETPQPSGYKPLPVHTSNGIHSDYLQDTIQSCKVLKSDEAKLNDESYSKLVNQSKFLNEVYEKILSKYEISINFHNFSDKTLYEKIGQLAEYYIFDYLTNPITLLNPEKDESDRILLINMKQVMAIFTNKQYIQTNMLRTLPAQQLRKIQADITGKTIDQNNSKKDFSHKYIAYSIHAEQLSSVLMAMGYFNMECLIDLMTNNDKYKENIKSEKCLEMYMAPASSVIFEQFSDNNDASHFVRINYNGNYINLCGISPHKEKHDCPVEKFEQLINGKVVTMDEYADTCVEKSVKIVLVYHFGGYVFRCSVVIFLLVVIAYLFCQTYRQEKTIQGIQSNPENTSKDDLFKQAYDLMK